MEPQEHRARIEALVAELRRTCTAHTDSLPHQEGLELATLAVAVALAHLYLDYGGKRNASELARLLAASPFISAAIIATETARTPA